MSRHLPILGLLVLPALILSACDSSSTLSKAKPGECYAVVGRDALGAPSLAKTPCAGSPAALAAACPTPTPAAPAVSCPATGAKVATAAHGAGGATARRSVKVAQRTRSSSLVSQASSRDDRVAKSGEVTSLGIEYARVGTELAGGPGYQADYERRETYDRVEHAPPPAHHLARRGASIEYSERSRQSSSYSESYSSSSSARGYGDGYCDCDGRGAPPHSPFDRYGYLTWRGKTPG